MIISVARMEPEVFSAWPDLYSYSYACHAACIVIIMHTFLIVKSELIII